MTEPHDNAVRSMTMQPFSWRHINQWHFGLVPLVLLVGAGLVYALAAHRASEWRGSRTAFFYSGLFVTFVATQSVIGVFDRTYFSDHMIQHLMLIMVAAPLFALSAPVDLAYAVGSTRLRALIDGRVVQGLTHPLVAFALYFVFIPLTHLTGLFNLMLEHDWIHHLEHIIFLVVGYVFFRAAFGIERGFPIHPGLRLVFVMAAVPVDTFTGLALSMSSHNPFPAYISLSPAGATPASILADIHLGGGVMWIGGDALMLLACLPIAVAWVRWETIRTREIDSYLDALGL